MVSVPMITCATKCSGVKYVDKEGVQHTVRSPAFVFMISATMSLS